MLIGIPDIIGSDLLKALADTGHGDLIVIADHFYPPYSKSPHAVSIQAKGTGAAEMLDMMKARGIPHAIATGADAAGMTFYMKVLGIGRWFDWDHIFCAHKGLPGKPDPAIYRLTMEKLHYDPANTVVVEDALAGIHSAIGAGVKAIVAIDTTLGADAFNDIPEVVGIIHDFHGFHEFLK